MDTMRAALSQACYYPDRAMRAARAGLALYLGVDENCVLPTAGGAAAIDLTLGVRRGAVHVQQPTFGEYAERAKAHGRRVASNQAIQADDTVVVCNPNNPTGTLLRRQELMALARGLKNVDCQLLIDESFLDFRRDEADFTLRQDAATQENILLVRSLTKFFAIPGLRLGFALGPKQLLHEMEQAKDVWNVNLLAQAAGAAMLSDQMYQKQTRAFIAAEKENLARRLKAIGHLRVYPPSVNFLFVRLEWTQHTDELLDFLRQKHILIRDCRHYPGLGRGFLRLAVRTRAENDRLLAAWHSYALLQGHEK